MTTLRGDKEHNFAESFSGLQHEEKTNLAPAVKILLLGADRDVVRAELAVAKGASDAGLIQARRDFGIISDAAQALDIDPKGIAPETPAETHVTREKVVALRELKTIDSNHSDASSIPVPSNGPLGKIFSAMLGEKAVADLAGSHPDPSLSANVEMLFLGAKRDGIKAEAAAGNHEIQQQAFRDLELITSVAASLGLHPKEIVPNTVGKAHVTRELIAASEGLPAEKRDEALASVNMQGPLNNVFQKLAVSTREAGRSGKVAGTSTIGNFR